MEGNALDFRAAPALPGGETACLHLTRSRNSFLVAWLLRNDPRTALVTMSEFCFWTPLIIMHK